MNDPRLMPGEHLVITADSYRLYERHREIGDRVIAALGYHPDDVVELRISEARCQVDFVDRRSRHVRTCYWDWGRHDCRR